MMVAGTETSATMMLWMACALHEHPEVRERMHEELDLVLAGRRLDYEDLPKLEYTGRVVQEARPLAARAGHGQHHLPPRRSHFVLSRR
jgi:cytochrome P450